MAEVQVCILSCQQNTHNQKRIPWHCCEFIIYIYILKIIKYRMYNFFSIILTLTDRILFFLSLLLLHTICEVSSETMARVSSWGHSRALETLVPPERWRNNCVNNTISALFWCQFNYRLPGSVKLNQTIWKHALFDSLLCQLGSKSTEPTSIGYQTNIVFAGQVHNFNYIIVTVCKDREPRFKTLVTIIKQFFPLYTCYCIHKFVQMTITRNR